jgi:hypothetical protein
VKSWHERSYSLAGPPRSGETSRLGSMDPVAERDQVRAAWWQEKQDEVMDMSRYRVVTHDQSLHAGFVAVHHKTVRLLGWATKPRPEARRAETGFERIEKLRYRGTRGRDRGTCVERTRTATKVWWPPDENVCYLTILPLRGVYLILSSKGSLVICPTRRDFIYIALRLDGKSSIRTATCFPCSIG